GDAHRRDDIDGEHDAGDGRGDVEEPRGDGRAGDAVHGPAGRVQRAVRVPLLRRDVHLAVQRAALPADAVTALFRAEARGHQLASPARPRPEPARGATPSRTRVAASRAKSRTLVAPAPPGYPNQTPAAGVSA